LSLASSVFKKTTWPIAVVIVTLATPVVVERKLCQFGFVAIRRPSKNDVELDVEVEVEVEVEEGDDGNEGLLDF